MERFSERLRNKETRPEAITEAVVAVAVVGVGLWALGTLLTCAAPAVDTGRRRNKVCVSFKSLNLCDSIFLLRRNADLFLLLSLALS